MQDKEQTQAPQEAPLFKFAFQGPGLSVSVQSSDPAIIGAYANLTLFGSQVGPVGVDGRQGNAHSDLSAEQPEPEAQQEPKKASTPRASKAKVQEMPPPAAEAKPEPAAPKQEAKPAAAPNRDDLTKETLEVLNLTGGRDGVKAILTSIGGEGTKLSGLKDEDLAPYAEKLAKLKAELGGK